MTLRISGSGASGLFLLEAGGHRWQRIPPTERGGRVHSSTVTVAVLPESGGSSGVEIRLEDLDIRTSRGSGPGGQKRNKVETAVTIVHRPTGITVHCESEVSQSRNKAEAMSVLQSRLDAAHRQSQHRERNGQRQSQVGTGMRSDKIRTVQVKNSVVTNHMTGRKCSLEKYLKGDIRAAQK
jgi:peptide chain release factor 1